jgi:hypothetical protein
MPTEKFEFSLRLRDGSKDLSTVTKQLGFSVNSGWDKGEQNRTLQGSLRPGTRDASYRSLNLGVATSTSLDDGISECLQKLVPVASVVQSFVRSGGMASLAVGWFGDHAVGGDRVSAEIIAEMARLNLTLDLYLYLTPNSPIVTEP